MPGHWIERVPGRQFQPAQEVLFDKFDGIFDAPFGVGRELRLTRVKQNNFSPSRIHSTLGAVGVLS